MQFASCIPDALGRGRLPLLVLLAGLAIGCEETPTEPTTPVTSPVTETFSSLLSPLGAATRTILVPDRGTVRVTLTSTTPAGLTLGLGIGIPNPSLTGPRCAFTVTAVATAGASPPLSVVADAGDVCVSVFDLGTLSGQIGFTLTIVRP